MRILDECRGAQKIGISGHFRPDGDCVGSCLALYQYLKKCLANEVSITVYLEKPAPIFAELKGFDKIESDFTKDESFDVFFVLDCNLERLGETAKYFHNAKKTINIDHHISNNGCGNVNYVVPTIGSTSEIIYDLIMEEGNQEVLDTDLAKAIYVGIIHDTGVFQYSNTTPKTMEIGARLISYGFDFDRIVLETFYQRDYHQTQILGRALMESIRFLDGQCIVSCVDQKMMDFYNVTTHDLDGIVNHLRNIKGVHCAIFMYQTGTLEYKISMRSDEKVNVAQVASYFGGGGHVRAAGCTMQGTFHDCVNNLSLHIEKQLKENADV